MTILVVATGLLGLLTVVHLALTFALIARVREVQARLPDRDPTLPKVGERVAPFEATTACGQLLTAEVLAADTTLVGFFTSGCEPCEKMKQALLADPPALPVIAFVQATDSDDGRALGGILSKVARVAYLVEDDAVSRAFKPSGFPTFLRLEGGAVAAAGHLLSDVLP